jgi:hypothetical protein
MNKETVTFWRWHLEAETCGEINKHNETAYKHLLDIPQLTQNARYSDQENKCWILVVTGDLKLLNRTVFLFSSHTRVFVGIIPYVKPRLRALKYEYNSDITSYMFRHLFTLTIRQSLYPLRLCP